MKPYFIIASLLIGACSAGHKENADSILFNARIMTMNDSMPSAEVMVIRQGKILAIGGKELLDIYRCPDSAMKDAGMQYVYPGLIDAHCHFYGYAKTLLTCNLVGTQSWEEVLQRVDEFAKNKPGGWINGRGWDQNDWAESSFPDNRALNQRYPDRPVFLRRVDGHAALCNQKALELAGIDKNTRVEGGEIILKDGQPGGILIDNAVDLVAKVVPKESPAEMCKALMQAEKECYAFGLTTLTDAGLDLKECLFLDSLGRKGVLSIFLSLMLNPTEEGLDYAIRQGILENGHCRIGAFKLYADGALGSRGAKLKQEYCDRKGHSGLLLNRPAYFDSFCRVVYRNTAYQLNTHCIGDSANRLILETYGRYVKPSDDRRWRIEHAQVVEPADIPLFGLYGIIPSVQPTHATSDAPWAEERLCSHRMAGSYAYQTLLRQNGYLPLGTDFPVEYINPFYTFYSAVFRLNPTQPMQKPFRSEESLSPEQALKGMTLWAARAAQLDKRKGSLEAGKDADYVILDRNLLKANAEQVLKTRVLLTCRMGRQVYAAPGTVAGRQSL